MTSANHPNAALRPAHQPDRGGFMFHRQVKPALEQVAAIIRVRDQRGNELTVIETWHRADGWLGRLGLAAERRFRLTTGEPVEEASDNVFLQLESLETLIRVRRARAGDVQPPNGRGDRPWRGAFVQSTNFNGG